MRHHSLEQENNVIDGLKQFNPRPSQRFYRRMASAPWMTEVSRSRVSWLHCLVSDSRWMPAVTLLVVLVVISVVLMTPPLEALAQELLGLFTQERSEFVTEEQLEADVSPWEDYLFSLSFKEAEEIAGFEVWAPNQLPEWYRLEEVAYRPAEQTVVSYYSYAYQPQLVIAQQPLSRINDATFRAGPAANIEVVRIGESTGEYVVGAWCGPSSDEQLRWCSDVNVRTLRWRRDDFVFTLSADGAPDAPDTLTREELIDLAAQLAPGTED